MSRSTTVFLSLLVLSVCLARPVVPALAAPAPSPGVVTTVAAAAKDKVNINSASAKELMGLEGVGKKLAEKIVEYREAHGPFRKAEDLRKVEGVGAALWEKNRERIVVK